MKQLYEEKSKNKKMEIVVRSVSFSFKLSVTLSSFIYVKHNRKETKYSLL